MTAMPSVALRRLVSHVSTWNPLKSGTKNDVFKYIDLSAVDQELKAITGARDVARADAPSRARQVVHSGDVLVSTVRPNLNGVAMVPPDLDGATASTGFCVIRANAEALEPRYVFHWVKSPAFVSRMVNQATGASYPAVSDRIVLNSEIPLPPLREQRHIAAILDKADTLRTKRREALTQLGVLGRSIFVEMFGDPAANPMQWPEATLGDMVHSASDGPHVSPTYSTSGIPFLSTRHVRPGEISWTDLKYIAPEDAEVQWKKCRPTRGDILYTKGGTTGYAAQVMTDVPFAVWVHVALLKPNRELCNPTWLEAMLNHEFCYRQSQELTHGIANKDLGLKRMVRIRMYQPPLSLQGEFARRLESLNSLRARYSAELTLHGALFESLQHRAFGGELRIQNHEGSATALPIPSRSAACETS